MDNRAPLENIQRLMAAAARPLILASRPVDPDCIGTALGLKWFLDARQKAASIACFFPIPPSMAGFPEIGQVAVADAGSYDFTAHDMIITVDGSSWGQFLGDGAEKVLERIRADRVVNIDHHAPGDIARAIPERCLGIYSSSTAQVLYEHIIEPSGLIPPPSVADSLYRALLYDTRGFRNEIYPGAYRFAEELVRLGADHAAAVDVAYDMREVRYLCWAIGHTEFLGDLGLMLLVIDAQRARELEAMLGPDCLEFDAIYKETIQRQVAGYDYGMLLTEKNGGSVRLNWRTRGRGATLPIAETARRAGFEAGGHRNAGGGTFSGSIAEARERLIAQLRRDLADADP